MDDIAAKVNDAYQARNNAQDAQGSPATPAQADALQRAEAAYTAVDTAYKTALDIEIEVNTLVDECDDKHDAIAQYVYAAQVSADDADFFADEI